MIPIRVALKGFMCYREEQVLNFAGAPLWVLAGPNGAGKSTVLDAITFALFGELREGDHDLQDLINHHSDSLEVAFDFSLNDKVYRVKRTRPRRGAPTFGVYRLSGMSQNSATAVDPIPGADSARGLRRWVEETIGLGFDAFTASALLRQGYSDQLLRLSPADRFAALAELIDLSRFRKLHERVDTRRREYAHQEEALRIQLASLTEVSEEALEEARAAAKRAAEAARSAQAEVEQLTRLVGQAQQWETLQARLTSIAGSRQRDQALIDRAHEIQRGYDRWRDLERVLPDVQIVVDSRDRLAALDEEMVGLQDGITALQPQVAEAEQEANVASVHAADLRARLDLAQTELIGIARDIADLGPLVSKLEALEEAEGDAQRWQADLAALPSNLAESFAAAQRRDEQLTDLRVRQETT